MEIRRCMKCMRELKPGETVCPECGQVFGSARSEAFALKPGTILDGKYLVGEMLGQGGFGITYIGFDLLLEQKVAIKEYYPVSTGTVSRENRTTVVWSKAMMEKSGVQKGFDSFLKEARKMAKLGEIPSVVGVKSVFIQNETAYIVMDFIEGETLLKKLKREGPMDFDTCVSLLKPIMQALAEVHEHGIIHRDISPDNIMVRKNGKLTLLDLGAAKDLEIQGADGTMQSSQLVAKQGFSPVEQYGRNGKIGPWTDVYAMAATIYYCCTGKLPPSAIDRIENDPLSCQPLLTQPQFDALAACMDILPGKRPQDMDAMLQIIGHTAEKAEAVRPVPPKPMPLKTEPKKPEPQEIKPSKRKPALLKRLVAIAAAGLAVLLAIAIGIGSGKQPDPPDDGKTIAAQTAPTESTAATTAPTEETRPAETVPEETIPAVHVMAAAEDLSEVDYKVRSDQFFWGQKTYKRSEVKTVTFQDSLSGAPGNAWDVSEAGDRSVLAWMDGGNLYVAANGKIAPNRNASWMFAYFEYLKRIDFGKCLDTSNVTDMSFMFKSCSGLTNLDVSGFDTANVTDMRVMFSGCGNLTSLDLSGFDTANVTDMSTMFSGCWNLTSLDLSGFDTANVTNMDFMFYKCSSLKNLVLSGFDTANVTNMGCMFNGCWSLTSLDLSGFNTAKVTDTSSMFWGCSSLTELDLSGFDTANVIDMGWMFNGCWSLTSLDLSGFDTANVTDMSGMFSECGSLTNLTCFDEKILAEYKKVFPNEPAKVPSEEVHVMAAAEDLSGIDYNTGSDQFFWGQTNHKRRDVETVSFRRTLESAPSYAWDVWDVSEAGDRSILAWMDDGNLYVAANGKIAPNPNASWMFACFENLKRIDFGDCFDTANVTNMDSMFDSCSSLTELDLSGFDTTKVTDMSGMFSECSSLTRLDLSSFDTTKVADMSGMFWWCNSLASLDLSGFDTANVKNMGYLFYGCNKLTSLDLSVFDTSNATSMRAMFQKCSNLTKLNLSSFDTANVKNMGYMFYECNSLTGLDLSGFDTASVTDMSYMFGFCSKLPSLDVSGFDTLNVTDMKDMFWMCSSLPSLDVSNFDTSNVTDMSGMFGGCSSLTELDFSGFDTANVTSMGSMFYLCNNLTSLDVSGFDTSNVTSMYSMFKVCSHLTSLDVSGFDAANVKYMGDMFSGCNSLTDLRCSDEKILAVYNDR